MAPDPKLEGRLDPHEERDPREEARESAQVIDLATRNVLPQVATRKRSDNWGMVAGFAIVAGLGAVTLLTLNASRTEKAEPASEVASAVPAPQPAAVPAPQPAPQRAAPQRTAAPAPAPVLSKPPQQGTLPGPTANPYSSPTVVFDASALPGPAIAAVSPAAGKGDANDDFAARIGGVGGTAATAEASFDPNTTVTQGTLIPAVLETAIDTDVPGYVRAIVSADVRSFDGARVLVPRSSRLIGQYKSGMQAGQKRAYVIWTRLIRPDGVSVNLGSPAVTFDGKTGLDGKVDSHFFQRFGSAMLLSVVGGLSTVATGGAGVVIAGGGQSAAAAAVQQNAQISPTIRVKQGQPIRVFTAKDLDFSKVQ